MNLTAKFFCPKWAILELRTSSTILSLISQMSKCPGTLESVYSRLFQILKYDVSSENSILINRYCNGLAALLTSTYQLYTLVGEFLARTLRAHITT